MAIYDKKPSIYEANGDGSYTYRWDIKEVEIPAGADTEETTTKWECQEVVVWGTVTSDKLTEAVNNHLWPEGLRAETYQRVQRCDNGDIRG